MGRERPFETEAADGKKTLQRTEFVILFVWKEPTPSDPPEEAAATETSSDSSAPSASGIGGSVVPEAPTPGRKP
jgi:hypothetical protein